MVGDRTTVAHVGRLRVALERLRTIDENMTVSLAISLLMVAAFEGRSLREYGELLKLPQSTVSRHLLDLGIMRRDRSPGMGLLTQDQDGNDLRKNVYRLSAKGKSLVSEIVEALRGGKAST